MATGRFFNRDGSFSEDTFLIPDDELETTMMDTEQEQPQVGVISLTPKLMLLTDDEMKAIFWLCIAYVHEREPIRMTRQRKAVESLLGPLTIGEWTSLGPLVKAWVEAQSA